MFSYQEYYVHKQLSPFIKKLWTLNNSTNSETISNKQVLPNGCFNIAVITGEGLTIRYLNAEIQLMEGVYFCGQMTEAVQVDIRPHTKAVMIQLYPWTPVCFTSLGMDDCADKIKLVDDMGDMAAQCLTGLSGLNNQQICRYLLQAFKPLLKPDTVTLIVTQTTQQIIDVHGNITIAELAANLRCSARYLQKLFKKHIGLSPKEFALIIKLRNAVDGISYPSSSKDSLTHLALTNQFYDQAHFNNTFQSIVKTSPKKFHVPDYFLSWKK